MTVAQLAAERELRTLIARCVAAVPPEPHPLGQLTRFLTVRGDLVDPIEGRHRAPDVDTVLLDVLEAAVAWPTVDVDAAPIPAGGQR